MGVFTQPAFKFFNKKLFVITPFDNKSVTGVGYDLRIGYYIKISQKKVIEKGKVNFEEKTEVELETGESLLIICHERIYLSNRIAGTIHCRGRYASKGLVLNSTTVDPLWNGRMVFLVTNIAGHCVSITLQEHFATIMLQKTYFVADKDINPPKSPKNVLIEFTRIYNLDNETTIETQQFAHPGQSDSEEDEEYNEDVIVIKSNTKSRFIYLYQQLYWFLLRFKFLKYLLLLIGSAGILVFILSYLNFERFFPQISKEQQDKINSISSYVTIATAVVTVTALIVKAFKKKSSPPQ